MSLRKAKDDAARIYLSGVIRETRGNMVHAARIAGVSRSWLHRQVDMLGIDVRGALGDAPRVRGHIVPASAVERRTREHFHAAHPPEP